MTQEIRRLTHLNGSCGHPAWSPNGDKILFVSMRDGKLVLAVIEIDGSGLKFIMPEWLEDRDVFNPSWAPGERISFVVKGHQGGPDALWTTNRAY